MDCKHTKKKPKPISDIMPAKQFCNKWRKWAEIKIRKVEAETIIIRNKHIITEYKEPLSWC